MLCECGASWNSDGVCENHINKGETMIIAFAGKMGSGKDTAAEFLKDQGYHPMAFADNLKEMAIEVFRLSKAECYDQDLKMKELKEPITLRVGHIGKIMTYAEDKNGFKITQDIARELYGLLDDPITLKTPREVLQYLGTEILRNCIDQHYHALVVKRKIDLHNIQKVAITDCRFPNERNFVKRWGGQVVLIDRPSKDITTTSGLSGHASENSLGEHKEYDHVIVNDTTLNALKENVLSLIN